MTATNKLALELLASAAANQALANTTFAQLNQLVMPTVVDKDLAAAPGSPADEALYIVAGSPTGAWAGKAGQLAYWLTSTAAWQFIVPQAGWFLHVNDEGAYYKYTGAAWALAVSSAPGLANPMTAVGDLIVGGTAGAAARLPKGGALQVLRVNAAGSGLEYADAAAGGGGSTFAPVIIESTTARTLALADAGAFIRHTNASASTVTVAPQSSVAWAASTEVYIRRAAAGNLTLTPGSGVTLNAPSGGTLVLTSGMSVGLKRVAENVWDVIGQTVAA
jgi:hypothetical protein